MNPAQLHYRKIKLSLCLSTEAGPEIQRMDMSGHLLSPGLLEDLAAHSNWILKPVKW